MNFGNLTRSKIKGIILETGAIDYQCAVCSISKWREEKLSLHLDHINGINDDNRLENLRFLCPNCHSQTETYCGKNNKSGYGSKNLKVSDSLLIDAINDEHNKTVKQVLDSVNLSGAGNYKRVYRLCKKISDEPKFISNEDDIAKRKSLLDKAAIDTSKYGWIQEAAKIIEKHPQRTRKWLLQFYPEYLENSFLRKS